MPAEFEENWTGEFCKKHPGVKMYKIGSKIVCGECQLLAAKRLNEIQIQDYCETHDQALPQYYTEVNSRKKGYKKK